MINIYTTVLKNKLPEKVNKITPNCWINLVCPNEQEIQYVVDKTGVNDRLLRYAIDTEEPSHVDTEDNQSLISVHVPIMLREKNKELYNTIPLGILMLEEDYVITICSRETDILKRIISNYKIIGEIDVAKRQRLLAQILYVISVQYILDLTHISKDMEKFEDSLTRSMTNKDLIKLVSYQKAMIYFNTAIKTNQSIIDRLSRGHYLKLTDKALQILDDAKIENGQALEMATTYSEILNGMTDIYGTIVSNSLNKVMKFLTSITLIISIPTLIASIMGMNVEFPFDVGVGGFFGVMLVTSIVTLIVAWLLSKKNML